MKTWTDLRDITRIRIVCGSSNLEALNGSSARFMFATTCSGAVDLPMDAVAGPVACPMCKRDLVASGSIGLEVIGLLGTLKKALSDDDSGTALLVWGPSRDQEGALPA